MQVRLRVASRGSSANRPPPARARGRSPARSAGQDAVVAQHPGQPRRSVRRARFRRRRLSLATARAHSKRAATPAPSAAAPSRSRRHAVPRSRGPGACGRRASTPRAADLHRRAWRAVSASTRAASGLDAVSRTAGRPGRKHRVIVATTAADGGRCPRPAALADPRQRPGIAGEPADGIEGWRQRHDPVDGDPPMGRPDPVDAAYRGGNPDGTAGIGAEREIGRPPAPPQPSRWRSRRGCGPGALL